MNVLEVKNNLVKISYSADDNLALSSFVIIEDSNSPYVAQVMNLKADNSSNFAIVKLLFTFDSEGILRNYNGTIPSTKATVSKIPSNELLDVISIENPLVLGELAQQNIKLKVDKSILENNLLICSDKLVNTEDLLDCITSQITDEKSVIIDSEGQLRLDNKVRFGEDFKLPLNVDTIDYIYENDLEDVDAVNKAVIQDILIEVQNYIKTLPEKFLPFDSFINVIDAQYRETQIPELILLKNKLLKYKELNVFAQNIKDVLNLNVNIDKFSLTVIDISTVPDEIQKEVIRYIYSALNEVDSKVYAFVKINNSNITKLLLKRFITKDNVYSTIICPHGFKYIEAVKEISQNMIFFAPLTLTHDFASYNTFLNKLNDNEFVVYGAHTQNIPLIVETVDDITEETETKIETIDSTLSDDETTEYVEQTKDESVDTVQDFDTIEKTSGIVDEFTTISDEATENDYTNSENLNDDTNVVEIVEDNPVIDEIQEESSSVINDSEYIKEENTDNSETLDEYSQEETVAAKDEVIEDVVNDVEVVEPLVSNEDKAHDEMVEQIAQDVERSFYKKLPQEDSNFNEPEIVEDELTEDDLNLIEDLAVDDDIALAGDVYNEEEYEDTIPVEEKEEPPVIPIYPADDIEEKEGDTFKPGDRVVTEKFGEGVVQKMSRYGNKLLYSIDFPEIGRRFLDANVTEIKKIQ